MPTRYVCSIYQSKTDYPYKYHKNVLCQRYPPMLYINALIFIYHVFHLKHLLNTNKKTTGHNAFSVTLKPCLYRMVVLINRKKLDAPGYFRKDFMICYLIFNHTNGRLSTFYVLKQADTGFFASVPAKNSGCEK
jgi:hypothetical protein